MRRRASAGAVLRRLDAFGPDLNTAPGPCLIGMPATDWAVILTQSSFQLFLLLTPRAFDR